MILSAVFWYMQYTGAFIFPFMNRVLVVFVVALVLAMIASILVPARAGSLRVELTGINYKTSPLFNIAGLGVMIILIALYGYLWDVP